MKAALVIMAAGLGSRYGGNKQVDGVGPQGEMLMEYSIYDAVRAGFTKVVFIIKPDMRELMDRLWGDRTLITKTGEPLEVCYAMQDFTSIPDYYTIPAGRTKPFGTAHAVLCARPYLSEPFCVINADDYYGVDAYRAMYEELQRLPRQGRATMVGYLLKNTVSANGTVSRGVCRVEDGWLRGIHETLKIQLFPDGSIADVAEGQHRELAPDTVVSMNFWGFMPSIFQELEAYFDHFLRCEAGDNIKAECLLPGMVGDLLEQGRLEVSVLHSADRWFGMTYHEDRQAVAAESNLRDVAELVHKMHREHEPLVHCAVYLEMTADSKERLRQFQTDVLTELVRCKLNVDKLLLRQKQGFCCVSPVGSNVLGREFERVLPAGSVANLYPFNYSGKTDPNGFYIGKDKYGSNIVVDFDRRDSDKTSANILILGNSGQGKSYLIKLLICNLLEAGKSVIALDAEHELEELCENLGGCFIDLMAGEKRINGSAELERGHRQDSPGCLSQVHPAGSAHLLFERLLSGLQGSHRPAAGHHRDYAV